MKTIISTFGISAGGIIASIKENGCDNLIVLVSDDMTKEAKDELKKLENITKTLGINIQKIIVSQYSLMENIQRIKSIIKAHSDSEILLNVTGGRKPLSLAATLAGFVSNPDRIIYVREEDNNPIDIPKFTIGEKLISEEKMAILNSINSSTTLDEIRKFLKRKKMNSTEYHTIMKHIRELVDGGLIKVNKGRPNTYSITPSGELLR